jgi:hypothetical protein
MARMTSQRTHALPFLLLSSVVACGAATAASPPTVTASGAAPPQAAAAPTPPPAPHTPSNATEVIASARAPFDACYALARKANPGLRKTNVDITFTMDNQGKLLSVDFSYGKTWDPAAKDCMRTAAEAVVFPPNLRVAQTQTGSIEFNPPQ